MTTDIVWEKITFRITRTMLDAVNEARRNEEDLPNRNEMLIRLVAESLGKRVMSKRKRA